MRKIIILVTGLFILVACANNYGGLFAMDEKQVILETNQGKIEIKLMPEVAPKACENFTKLVEKGYYDGIIFHRVIKGFMIQGGDPTGTGRGGESIWGKVFEDEVRSDIQFDSPGMLAMANAGPGPMAANFLSLLPRLLGLICITRYSVKLALAMML